MSPPLGQQTRQKPHTQIYCHKMAGMSLQKAIWKPASFPKTVCHTSVLAACFFGFLSCILVHVWVSPQPEGFDVYSVTQQLFLSTLQPSSFTFALPLKLIHCASLVPWPQLLGITGWEPSLWPASIPVPAWPRPSANPAMPSPQQWSQSTYWHTEAPDGEADGLSLWRQIEGKQHCQYSHSSQSVWFSHICFTNRSGKGLWSSPFRSWCSTHTTISEARLCKSKDFRDLLTAKERPG